MTDLLWNISHNKDQVVEFRTAGMAPPNSVLFGCGAIERLGKEAVKLNAGKAGKVLFVSDNILSQIGVVERLSKLLTAEGFKVETFTDVEPEPHIETAEKMYDLCAKDKFSLVVGVGGGSVMDLAKLTAQAVARGIAPREFFVSDVKPQSHGLPLMLAPTTAGTGSEVSPYLVAAVGEEKRFLNNAYFYADLALIDPMLSMSMPPRLTASTGMDALSHAVEAMLHKQANPLSDAFSLAGIEMVGGYLRRAYSDGQDIEARYYMAFAASLCMMGMALCGATYAHSVSYVITKFKPTPHGLGCALGLPYTMAYNLPVTTNRLARIGAALGEPTWMFSRTEAAKRAVHAVVQLMRDLDMPVSLREYGVKEGDLKEMAELMMKIYHRPMNSRSMNQEEATVFWQKMWEGTI